MRGLRTSLAALILAAAPAAAQVKVLIPRINGGPAGILPTTVQSIPQAGTVAPFFGMSVAPALTGAPGAVAAPDVLPQSPLSVLPTLVQPAAVQVSDSEQEAVLSFSAEARVLSAPSFSAANVIHQDIPSRPLGELFDGSAKTTSLDSLTPIPNSREVLSRMEARKIPASAAADALAAASDPRDAARRLADLGLLTADERDTAHPSAKSDFKSLLGRLWYLTSPSATSKTEIDSSWPVPALVVRKGSKTYFIHPIAHGQWRPNGRGAVLGLVRRIRKSGQALYSEQILPAFYGYRDGRETLDHAVLNGRPVTVVDASRGGLAATIASRLIEAMILSAPFLLAVKLYALALNPVSWPFIALGGIYWFLYLRSKQPLLRRQILAEAQSWRALGDEDRAAWIEAEARALYGGKFDLSELSRLTPPPSLGIGKEPFKIFTGRSMAMADAVAADSQGSENVHIITGYEHAHEIAWRLENPIGPKATTT